MCRTRYLCIDSNDIRRNVTNPRALATLLEQAEAKLAKDKHPDPYIRELSDNHPAPQLTCAQHPFSLAVPSGRSILTLSSPVILLTLAQFYRERNTPVCLRASYDSTTNHLCSHSWDLYMTTWLTMHQHTRISASSRSTIVSDEIDAVQGHSMAPINWGQARCPKIHSFLLACRGEQQSPLVILWVYRNLRFVNTTRTHVRNGAEG